MVSAGGGGGYEWCSGGHAGGLVGGNSVGKVYTAYEATQTRGNVNGIGDNGYSKDDVQNGGGQGNCGCGGGYYGGKTSEHEGFESDVGGSGGSSYISGHPKCLLHSSGFKFSNTKMLAGNERIPLPSGDYAIGNYGDGYVRIQNFRFSEKNVASRIQNLRYFFRSFSKIFQKILMNQMLFINLRK
ncbi:loricrin, putative [Trichomonas vaginalis G3]|uniref:receptor protein-tyrosine kinase n=1 Tax=Trichomonas vaginalis (strain ATCC PRA-98 / G3) TaxID=412133 RepID=A2EH54_TRIV3|nr:glycine-rich protein family [Trichomonas vaginalis G3]EAY08022.1 loricrin, putative [Trichomonas vaginalis G3]KAI5537353.1 glycine-rich protein family [Trichomonas vaginalis G3]|eukprot:XP_001320245.1 loricrin [Trichomonas vaginalis G3]